MTIGSADAHPFVSVQSRYPCARWSSASWQVLEYASIIVMAEGAVPREDTMATTHEGELDAFGHARLGGIGAHLEREIEVRTGKAALPPCSATSSAADHRRRTIGCDTFRAARDRRGG